MEPTKISETSAVNFIHIPCENPKTKKYHINLFSKILSHYGDGEMAFPIPVLTNRFFQITSSKQLLNYYEFKCDTPDSDMQ
jgi:hypothetical protein